jgi:hypothetical protein
MTLVSSDRKISQTSLYPRRARTALFALTALATVLACGDEDEADPLADYAPASMGTNANGVPFPMGVQDWGVVSAIARPDAMGNVRVLLGNEIAVDAARSGDGDWPEGTMLSHLVWSAEQNPDDVATVNPGSFRAVTLMVKDSSKYADDGNWAYGIWTGDMLMSPDPAAPNADVLNRGCVNCHTSSVADKDMVFTDPPTFPTQAQIDGLADGANGVTPPEGILDWRVLGVARINNPNGPQVRVLVGNDTAVDASRAGETNPWPDGSMISHFVWGATENPVNAIPGALVPSNLAAITLMQRSAARYAADGDWAYGRWAGADLAPLAEGDDRQCVSCHTENVADRDMVFSRMGELPDLMQ